MYHIPVVCVHEIAACSVRDRQLGTYQYRQRMWLIGNFVDGVDQAGRVLHEPLRYARAE